MEKILFSRYCLLICNKKGIRSLCENPCMQYFVGLESFTSEPVMDPLTAGLHQEAHRPVCLRGTDRGTNARGIKPQASAGCPA